MPSRKDFGRVYFPGCPWPQGHRILKCDWTARIERATGLWFDFHIESEEYYAADKGKNIPEEDEDVDVIASRTLWYNNHHMTLSTTEWPGLAYGVHAGSQKEPFNFKKLSGQQYKVDDPPAAERFPRPFCISRWDFEDVAYQSIKIRKETKLSTFAIHWKGRIGSFTNGNPDFPYTFELKLKSIPFQGIIFPSGTNRHLAYDLATPYLHNAEKYKFRNRKDHVALTPG